MQHKTEKPLWVRYPDCNDFEKRLLEQPEETLGIDNIGNKDKLRKHLLSLKKVHHPDKNRNNKNQANSYCQLINAAIDNLEREKASPVKDSNFSFGVSGLNSNRFNRKYNKKLRSLINLMVKKDLSSTDENPLNGQFEIGLLISQLEAHYKSLQFQRPEFHIQMLIVCEGIVKANEQVDIDGYCNELNRIINENSEIYANKKSNSTIHTDAAFELCKFSSVAIFSLLGIAFGACSIIAALFAGPASITLIAGGAFFIGIGLITLALSGYLGYDSVKTICNKEDQNPSQSLFEATKSVITAYSPSFYSDEYRADLNEDFLNVDNVMKI